MKNSAAELKWNIYSCEQVLILAKGV